MGVTASLMAAVHNGAGRSRFSRVVGSVHGVQTAARDYALTFDDGPDPDNTPAVLSVLSDHHVRATFFMLVEAAAAHPDLVAEVVAGGHEVALHGWNHRDLTTVSPLTVYRQVRGGRRRLEQLAGQSVNFFRPPYGTQTVASYAAVRTAGMDVVVWTASPRDFLALPLERHADMALDELTCGGILLLHDGAPAAPERRAALVHRILDRAGDAGWRATTVGQLLQTGEAVHRPWLRRRAEAMIDELKPLYLSSMTASD